MNKVQLIRFSGLVAVAATTLLQAGCNKKSPSATSPAPMAVTALSKNVEVSENQNLKISNPNSTLELNSWLVPTLFASPNQHMTRVFTFDSEENIRFGIALKDLNSTCGLRGPRPTFKFELRRAKDNKLVAEDMELLTSGSEVEPKTLYRLNISFQGAHCRSLNLQFVAWGTADSELTGAGYARHCQVDSSTDSEKQLYIVEQSRKEFASDLRVLREKTGSLFDEDSILLDFKKACDEEFDITDLNQTHGCSVRNRDSVVCEYPRELKALLAWGSKEKTRGVLKCIQGSFSDRLFARPVQSRNTERRGRLSRDRSDVLIGSVAEDSVLNEFKLTNCKDTIIGWSF